MLIETIHPHERVILVTGDRKWTNLEYVAAWAEETLRPNDVLVHGYAEGLDIMAKIAAEALGIRVVDCPAHWRHSQGRYLETFGPCPVDCREYVGPAAGPIRNHFMLDSYHPVEVHGFHERIHESKGTREMLTYAVKKKVPSYLHDGSDAIIRLSLTVLSK